MTWGGENVDVFIACLAVSGLAVAVHKIKRCENIAVWLGYAVLVYAGIDAIRGLF